MVMRAHTQSLNVPTGEDINFPVGISVQSFKFILIGGGKGFLVDIRTTHHFLLTMTVQMFCFMSQLILGNPRELTKKTCLWGLGFDFESCPRGRNSTRTRILWKMKVKLQKNSVDQIFTGENKNKLNFLPFLRFVFCQWNFSWSMGQLFGSAITHMLQKL